MIPTDVRAELVAAIGERVVSTAERVVELVDRPGRLARAARAAYRYRRSIGHGRLDSARYLVVRWWPARPGARR